MKNKTTLLIAVAAIVAIVLVAAGSASGAPRGTKVGVRSTALGRIVVDSKGRTLYLFEKDKKGHSACYGQCAMYWPPLLSHGKPLAGPGIKRSLLGTTRRTNGTEQVTYAGHPLYRYVGDSRPGETTGEGSLGFGAAWDVVSPAGKQIEAGG
jgi:predicted lipoprotein with Yx(FWY)xxD motif